MEIIVEDDYYRILQQCIEYNQEFIDNYPTAISNPDFQEMIIESTKEFILSIITPIYLPTEELNDEIEYIINRSMELFYIQVIPPRAINPTVYDPVENKRKRMKTGEK